MSRHLSLSLIVFISAAASMALEIAAGRMIAPYVGMSLHTWTAIIAVVLAGLALGHWIGGVLADRRAAGRWMLGLLIASAVFAFASQFVLRGTASALLAALPPVGAVLALSMAAFFLPSLTAGAVSPIATTLALADTPPERQGQVLGRMYALGAAGAILGTVASGLVLIPWLGSARTIGAIAAAYLAIAALAGGRRTAILCAAGAVAALGTTVAFGSAWSPCQRESGYFCIRVDDLEGGAARVLALDHLAHGVNDRADPQRLHSPYVALIDALARQRLGTQGPARAFFIGGGAYTLPRAWAARWPQGALTVAEIDPAVTAVAAARLWLDPAPLDIRHADARQVLAQSAGGFDAVIGDAFADISIPPHLVTSEMFALIREKLNPDGFYAMNVVDLLYRPRFLAALAQTLGGHFAHVELWLDEAAVQPQEGRATWIVLAAQTPGAVGRIAADDGSGRAWIRVPLAGMLEAAGDPMVLTDDHAPVARLLGPLLTERQFAE